MRYFLVFITNLFFLSSLSVNAQNISAIKIEGNERIEESSIKSISNLSIGDTLTTEKTDSALKNLYASNLFQEVSIDNSGGNIKITVRENSKINKVIFEGNKRIKDEDLQREISLSARSIYTKSKLQNDINRIIEIYSQQGRYSVKVVPKLVNLSQNRIDIIFEIDEGPKSVISKILFIGNQKFSDNKLKSVIQSSETAWYSFLSSKDQYNSFKIEYDKELLTRFYKSKGYATFQVISAIADLNENRDKFFVTFTVEEGPKFTYGNIDVSTSLKKIDISKASSLVKTKKGSKYNLEEIEKTTDILTKFVNDQGFAFVSVDPVMNVNEEAKTIDITYHIQEGRKAYLRQINIKGNLRTADKVIRREFKIEEGDAFSISKISESERNINNLDFFEKVEVKHHATNDPDKFDIDVEVEEKSTASINFAAGFNTSEGPIGMIGVTEKNLFGNGQELSIGITKAKRKVDYDLSFTEPYFMDLPLAAGFDLYKSENKKDKSQSRSYDIKSKGLVLRASYEIVDKVNHYPRYSLSSNNIDRISSDASEFVKKQSGKSVTSAIGHKIVYDNLDSRMNPTSGLLTFVDQQYAGVGGTVKYLRNEVGAGYYIPVIGEDVILELAGFAGHIKGTGGNIVRLNDRFSTGGDHLRGFEHGGVGPRAKVLLPNSTPNSPEYSNTNYSGDSMGGNYFYSTSAELKVPFTSQKDLGIFGSVFADAGEVFKPDYNKSDANKYFLDRGIRASVGLGLGFLTPMGPIKLTYAIPVKKKPFDRTERFYISFQTSKF